MDYVTPEGNYEGFFEEGGIRMYHIDADMSEDKYAGNFFTYEGFSQFYDTSYQGKRVIRLVNDGAGFYHPNDVIESGEPGFAWYAEDATETEESGFSLTVGAIVDGKCEVTVDWN
ncbi:MAG: hypothetical protein E7256_12655 [Lachnospiraceae bacterium]|nr:hypothetical protein [Lachnospiraceae bacterium]